KKSKRNGKSLKKKKAKNKAWNWSPWRAWHHVCTMSERGSNVMPTKLGMKQAPHPRVTKHITSKHGLDMTHLKHSKLTKDAKAQVPSHVWPMPRRGPNVVHHQLTNLKQHSSMSCLDHVQACAKRDTHEANSSCPSSNMGKQATFGRRGPNVVPYASLKRDSIFIRSIKPKSQASKCYFQ
ncbi:hypothetical protein PIB30_092963, partial [Stylosanthes scabra]|nr:hypothetical protein [Stylosanthes scabra]